jgi:ArsR family transcriptional regulator
MNMKKPTQQEVSAVFSVLGNPFRIQLLFTLGEGEACVCHLETILKKRQAYISQHLSVLRDAGILETRRDGKYIFYRVADTTIFDLIEQAASFLNIPTENLPEIHQAGIHPNCACPNCNVENPPQ